MKTGFLFFSTVLLMSLLLLMPTLMLGQSPTDQPRANPNPEADIRIVSRFWYQLANGNMEVAKQMMGNDANVIIPGADKRDWHPIPNAQNTNQKRFADQPSVVPDSSSVIYFYDGDQGVWMYRQVGTNRDANRPVGGAFQYLIKKMGRLMRP